MKNNIAMYSLLALMGVGLIGASGVVSAQGLYFKGTPENMAERQTEMFQMKAQALGISVDAVKNAWAEGKSLEQLAAENGISSDDLYQRFKTERTARAKSHLETMVEEGVITQAQADTHLKVMEERTGEMRGEKAGMGRKGMGGRGFHSFAL